MVRRGGLPKASVSRNGQHTFCLVSVTIPGKNRPAIPFRGGWALCFQGRRFIENGNSGGESNGGSLVGKSGPDVVPESSANEIYSRLE
jgi:hypothetical protein